MEFFTIAIVAGAIIVLGIFGFISTVEKFSIKLLPEPKIRRQIEQIAKIAEDDPEGWSLKIDRPEQKKFVYRDILEVHLWSNNHNMSSLAGLTITKRENNYLLNKLCESLSNQKINKAMERREQEVLEEVLDQMSV